MGKWEDSMRKLVRAQPQAFIDLLLAQLGVQRRVRFTGYQRSEKLKDSPLEVDNLIDVVVNEDEEDEEEGMIHFEFQTYYASNMPERLLGYNVNIRRELKRPVLSCVFHLLKDSRMKLPPLHWTEPIQGNVVQFQYGVVEIGDFLPEDIFDEIALLPLIPLTNGGATREHVERMLGKLSAKEHEEFAFVGFTLARAMFDKSNNVVDREWLIERYKSMNSMLHDLLNEDPLYLSIMHKGEEQGLQKGLQQLRQMLVRRVQKRFPVLAPLAQEQSMLIEDMGVLGDVIDAIIDAQTIEEARCILEEAHSSP